MKKSDLILVVNMVTPAVEFCPVSCPRLEGSPLIPAQMDCTLLMVSAVSPPKFQADVGA